MKLGESVIFYFETITTLANTPYFKGASKHYSQGVRRNLGDFILVNSISLNAATALSVNFVIKSIANYNEKELGNVNCI